MGRDLEDAGFGRPGDLLLKYCREVTVNEGDKTWKHYVLRHFCVCFPYLYFPFPFCVLEPQKPCKIIKRRFNCTASTR